MAIFHCYVSSPEGIWTVYEQYMNSIWTVYEQYMNSIWTVYEDYEEYEFQKWMLIGIKSTSIHSAPLSAPSWSPRNSFFYDTVPISARHQLRRDFPLTGDCAYACFQDNFEIGHGRAWYPQHSPTSIVDLTGFHGILKIFEWCVW